MRSGRKNTLISTLHNRERNYPEIETDVPTKKIGNLESSWRALFSRYGGWRQYKMKNG